jgi:hypothetical protein
VPYEFIILLLRWEEDANIAKVIIEGESIVKNQIVYYLGLV